jgi:acetyltransferase-like isoleucine patch superfamily enzyme
MIECATRPMSRMFLWGLDALRARVLRDALGAIGEGSFLRPGAVVYSPGRLRIGTNTGINDAVVIYAHGGVTIGDDVLIAAGVVITSGTHPTDAAERRTGRLVHAPVEIRDGAWIGANATILTGVTIGAGAIVAAGAVVTRDVPDGSTVAGVPARILQPSRARGVRHLAVAGGQR